MYNNNEKSSKLFKLKNPVNNVIREIMASCHTLTKVQNQIIGDPLDIKMFESCGWILEDNNENKYDDIILAVVKPK